MFLKYGFFLSRIGSAETLPDNLLHCPNWVNEQRIGVLTKGFNRALEYISRLLMFCCNCIAHIEDVPLWSHGGLGVSL